MSYFPHQDAIAPKAVLGLLCKHKPASVVVATGQYSPNPEHAQRTLFFTEQKERLTKIVDTWLSPDATGDVIRMLRHQVRVATGSCSAMYTTKAAVVWADCGDELRLWRHGRLVARFKARETELRPWLIGPWRKFNNAHFSFTHGFLSNSWLQRGVRLQRKAGGSVAIANMIDPIVFFDPTYDGMDLMCDANWVPDLARAISEITTVPLKLDSPLG